MNDIRLLILLGLASCAVACGSDSNTSPGGDSGTGGSDTGGSGATGGKSSAGGTAGKGGTASGAGGSTPGAGGATSTGGDKATGGTSPGTGGNGAGGASGPDGGTEAGTGTGGAGPAGDGGLHIEHVFVIAMENHDQSQIVGNEADAPYINKTLIKQYASTSKFVDTLDLSIPSEPHYVLLEAGTNAFSDVTFTGDANPSAGNSTYSTEHLVTQMKNASPSISWMSYQEGLDATSGACPINTSGYYAPKHDPFIFFQDVVGSPPSETNAYCVAHHAPLTDLATDLANDTVAAYNFVTPNQCNDMHGQAGCPNSNAIRSGDDWLKDNLPALEAYASGHRGVIFIVWDEGASTETIPFLAIGPSVKKNFVSKVQFTHTSVVKSVEEIFGLPYLATVKNATDLSDLFESGRFP
jgi:hypothetical protein